MVALFVTVIGLQQVTDFTFDTWWDFAILAFAVMAFGYGTDRVWPRRRTVGSWGVTSSDDADTWQGADRV